MINLTPKENKVNDVNGTLEETLEFTNVIEIVTLIYKLFVNETLRT